MTVEQLRKTHQAQPFEPFVLRTADGREFQVNHPEVLAISPIGRTVVVMTPDGTHDVIDLLLVASIHMTNHARPRRRKRS